MSAKISRRSAKRARRPRAPRRSNLSRAASILASCEAAGVYAMDVRGDCLAPEVNDGDFIIADASAHPENGDLACVHFRSDHPAMVKRCAMVPPKSMMTLAAGSEVMPVLVLEMLNPPKRGIVAVDKVAAIHRVIEVVRKGAAGGQPGMVRRGDPAGGAPRRARPQAAAAPLTTTRPPAQTVGP